MGASITNFVSVLKKATSTGSVTIKIKSRNRGTPIVCTVTVSNIPTSESENDIAARIKDAIDAQLLADDILYEGVPSFQNATEPTFTVKTYQCDHYICLWSESSFEVEISGTPTGGIIVCAEDIPLFMTLEELNKYASRGGVDISTLFDSDKTDLLTIISQQVITFCGRVPTATIYLHEERGYMQEHVTLDYPPILEIDAPAIQGKSPLSTLTSLEGSNRPGYDLDHSTGVLTFEYEGVFGRTRRRPMSYTNFFRMTYVGGSAHIKPSFKFAAAKLIHVVKVPPHLARLKVGTYQADFRSNKDYTETVKKELLGAI